MFENLKDMYPESLPKPRITLRKSVFFRDRDYFVLNATNNAVAAWDLFVKRASAGKLTKNDQGLVRCL